MRKALTEDLLTTKRGEKEKNYSSVQHFFAFWSWFFDQMIILLNQSTVTSTFVKISNRATSKDARHSLSTRLAIAYTIVLLPI